MQCCSILSCLKIGFIFRGADPSLRETPKCYLGKRERQGEGEREGEGGGEREREMTLHSCMTVNKLRRTFSLCLKISSRPQSKTVNNDFQDFLPCYETFQR